MAASRNAVLGVGRLNAFRLNYVDRAILLQRLSIVQASVDNVAVRVRAGSMTLRDVLNDQPNTCSFVLDHDTPPTVGGRLRVYAGVAPQFLLFSGQIQQATRTFVGRPTEHAWQCEAIDDTARGDWLRPFADFVSQPAENVAQWLVYNFTPGPLSSVVQQGLPPVTVRYDGTSRLNEAIRELAKLIGGYFYWEDGVLHLFVDPEPGLTPDAITGGRGLLLLDPAVDVTQDDAQIRTRVYGRGHAEMTVTPIDGGETLVPIADAVMFTASGGQAIAGAQRLTYTGVVLGGTGALVGPGVTPSAPPIVAAVGGSGVTNGAHNYALSWVTAAGETLPSPIASVTVNASAPTPVIDTVETRAGAYGEPPGTVCHYRIYISDKFYNGTTYPEAGVLFSNASLDVAVVSQGNENRLLFTVTPEMRGRYVVPVCNTGSGYKVVGAYWNYTGYVTPFAVNEPLVQNGWVMSKSYLGPEPHGGTLVTAQVAVSGIAVGPSGTTARKLYRTKAGLTVLQLLTVISDNSTTTYTDATADASLGAAPPLLDTSGLRMEAGQIPIGATAFPVSSTAWALPGGGWAIVGNGDVVVRYHGISGNQLTGIPATGNGSVMAPINYNSTITGAPMLTGVTWQPPPGYPPAPVLQGTDVAIWVQRDDLDAQTALAARWGTGIIEHIITDGRRGERSLTALCDADLAMFSRPLVTVRYTTLDAKSKSGRPVLVNLPDLGINQTLTIQDVTIDNFGATPPRFHVTAGSMVISLEAMLRQIAGTLAENF